MKHWKNILIAALVALLLIETVILWQRPIIFKRLIPVVNQPAKLQVSTVVSNDKKTTIQLNIDFKGQFSINGRVLKDNKKETLFHAMLDVIDQQNQPLSLLLRFDQHANTQSLMTALDVASRVGLSDVSLQTINP